MKPMKLTIEVEFRDGLSERAQQDVKRAVHEFKESLYLGRVVRAHLAEVEVGRSAPETT